MSLNKYANQWKQTTVHMCVSSVRIKHTHNSAVLQHSDKNFLSSKLLNY